MTRKHFEALAKLLREGATTEQFADYLETQNPNFDRERFLEAATA